MRAKRRFLTIRDRRVHYWRAGEGAPCVLIHSSPANARLLMKEIEHLSPDWTVFAFDTPGFGLSDPLPAQDLQVSDLADALAETLAAIGMPPCPMFGTHTGAAIALEFGVRHAERVTGLVLDGVPVFTDEECTRFFGNYFQKIPETTLGGHYSEVWTRFRDQSIWFPWSERRVEHLNPYGVSPPHSTHLWTAMYFEAADHYAPAYRAASYYGARALVAAQELSVGAIYTATNTDMLYPHLSRLPATRPGQEIREIGSSFERKRALISESFARFGASGPPPHDSDAIGSANTVSRQFLEGRAGQVHLRYCGDCNAPPLLMLHDAPGSSEQLEAQIQALSRYFFVLAPDLPGNGESDPFRTAPGTGAFADECEFLLDTLKVGRVLIHGTGFGASVALEIAVAAPERVAGLALSGLLLPDPTERETLAASFAPPILIEADGSHWYRLWLMLRDSLIYWPWYDRQHMAQRRVEADFSARRLHRWTLDVMRSRQTYHQLIQAALTQNGSDLVRRLTVPTIIVKDPDVPSSVYNDRLIAELPAARVIALDDLAQTLSALY